MFLTSLATRLALSFGLSLAAVVGTTVIQARLLFPQFLARSFQSPQSAIRRIVPVLNRPESLVTFTTFRPHPRTTDAIDLVAWWKHQADQQAVLLQTNATPAWREVAVTADGRCFLLTVDGRLYGGTIGLPCLPEPIGKIPGTSASGHQLECSDDGSLVIAVGKQTTLWDTQRGELLWHYDNWYLTTCEFVPGSHRLIGGTRDGRLLEIDPRTGTVVRQLASGLGDLVYVHVSPDCQLVAAFEEGFRCIVVDFQTGQKCWSKELCRYGVRGAFTPDSQQLLIVNAERSCDIGVLSARTGALHDVWSNDGWLAKGVVIAGRNTAVVWSNEGTIAEFDLATGHCQRRYRPLVSGAMQPVLPATGPALATAISRGAELWP